MRGLTLITQRIVYFCMSLLLGLWSFSTQAQNQTEDVSPIYLTGLPFKIQIETLFQLPRGIHSGVYGKYKSYWVFIAGRTNGLHGFNDFDPNNFPPDQQNTSIYVVDFNTGAVFSRSLLDPGSGLNQQQIDTLSVTSPQGYQEANTLYMSGGYGFNSLTNNFDTKPVFTAINLPGIVAWVLHPGNPAFSVAKNIRQITHPIFQITGGRMFKLGRLTQIAFGQNFQGPYSGNSNGIYSKQVRQFLLRESHGQMVIDVYPSKPSQPDPNYRRRDLNILPVLRNQNNHLQYAYVAYSGVFTLETGVWTVPVVIPETGDPIMADPASPLAFKQGMNNYASATASLYSRRFQSTFNIFFGGLSYEYFIGNQPQFDSEIPFINQVTTIQLDKNGLFTQYLMDGQFPLILSTQSNPGNPLLFGTGAYFIPANIPQYSHRIISLDAIRKPTVIGYIVGGIQSTLPNTNTQSDSAASPFVFKVTLTPTA